MLKRPSRLVTIGAISTLAVIPIIGAPGHGLAATPTPPIQFSHEVVVDEQRNGFEPDIEASSTGAYYTSVPNGSSSTL
ncbi:MAG TPA: hypothetical protein VKI19_08595, partial [Acidimicrobiales bacterium]|nr:hypothetical protein [Acidimicrobiales bacterium]